MEIDLDFYGKLWKKFHKLAINIIYRIYIYLDSNLEWLEWPTNKNIRRFIQPYLFALSCGIQANVSAGSRNIRLDPYEKKHQEHLLRLTQNHPCWKKTVRKNY